MLKQFKKWFGLEKRSEYVENFLFRSNVKAVIYMAIVVILLELWMIERLTKIVLKSWPRSFEWLFDHYRNYVILLSIAVIALVYAIRYIKGKTRNQKAGRIILWTFSAICIFFGIEVGVSSYAAGEQVLTFLTMTVFVFCILYWKPMQSLIFSAGTFLYFYYLLDQTIPATVATSINLFTMWIATYMVAMSAYHQKIAEAENAERIEAINAHLTKISNEDELTGIHNMRYFHQKCEEILHTADAEQYTFLYFDIENFKSYNEKYGYKKGDELLKDISRILLSVFTDGLIARFSDDHFVAFVKKENVTDLIIQAGRKIESLSDEIRIILKTGSCEPGLAGNDVALACDHARIACNSIKKQYQKYYLAYDAKLDQEVQRKQYIINNIDNAVALGWIKVFYQPVVKCANGHAELVGLEALARWDDPELGLLPPFAFIETLEEYHEINKLDQCIIDHVCKHLREDIDAGRPVVPVSINFSRLDFELYDVPDYLHDMIVLYDLPSNLIDVEITESALTDQMNVLQENMSRLHSYNFSLWLDDFGSGYSSLNVLKDFRFDVLKLDMMFLRDFPQNQKSEPIIKMVVELAHKLGMITLCEGVETKEQFEFLQSVGCDKAQGYYFNKPLPREEVLKQYYNKETVERTTNENK